MTEKNFERHEDYFFRLERDKSGNMVGKTTVFHKAFLRKQRRVYNVRTNSYDKVATLEY